MVKHPSYNDMKALRAKGWTLKMIGDQYGLTRARINQILGSNNRKRPGFKVTCQTCGKTTAYKTAASMHKYGTACIKCLVLCKCGRPKALKAVKCRKCSTNPNEALICYLYDCGFTLWDIANADLGIISSGGVHRILKRCNTQTRSRGPRARVTKPLLTIGQAIEKYQDSFGVNND